mgnify:CR=1 FL=1
MDVISIVYASELVNQPVSIIQQNSNIDLNQGLRGEIVLIFRKRDVMMNQTVKIWQQFNLDFDRQVLNIDQKRCQSRCYFFRKITNVLKHPKHLDYLLFLCQQTIFGNILQSIYHLLQNYPILIVDYQKPTDINIKLLPEGDVSFQMDKELKIVLRDNPEISLRQLTLRIIILSIRQDKEIQVHANFHD